MARLPDEYQEVEYIESTGTQYIDTGVLANGSFDADFKINTLNAKSTVIAGARSTTQHLNFGQIDDNGTGGTFAYLNKYWSLGISDVWSPNTDYSIQVHVESGDQYIVINGTKLGQKNYTGTEKLDLTVHLFERNFHTAGADTLGKFVGRMYYFKMWNNGELVRDFIPVKRRSDNVVGMYDTVEGKFYTNSGTGTFEVGPDVNRHELRIMYWKGDRLPAEYQELSYIESTGTQYIDTGWFPKSTNLEVSFKVMALQSMATSSICGDENNTYLNARWLFTLYGQNNSWEQYPLIGNWNNRSESGYHISTPQNKIVSATIKYNNGVTTCSSSEGNNWTHTQPDDIITNHTGTLKLFQNTNTQKSTIRMYEYTIKDNEVLVRDFKPCFRKSDNAVGMYDTVGGKFYTNSGTGTFKKGAYASLPNDYQQLTYIESTGTQWLDTGYAFKSDKARLEIKFMNTEDNNGKNICSSSDKNQKSFGFYQYQSDALTSYNGTNMNNRTPIPVKDGIVNASIETFGINTRSTSIINGVSFTANQTASIISNVTFGLFTKHDSDTSYIGTRLVKARIYLCKLWDNNVLVRDLIPCYRKSDGVIGMFDLVNATFYANAGSGTFVKGATKQDLRFFYAESGKLPSEYQALEYLDTDNQYFETLLNYEACTIEQVVKFEFDTRRRLIGWATNNTRYWGADASNRYETGPNNVIPADKALATEWHNVKFTTDGKLTAPTATVLVDDKFSTTRIGSGSATLSTSYDYVTADYRSVAYFKFIKKILPDGTVKNNLRPCVRKSDNKVGWYDLVTAQFLPNNCKAGQYKKTLRIIYM